jgi:hypothetical protein
LRLELDRDLVVSLHCDQCHTDNPVMRPAHLVGMKQAKCPRCDHGMRPRLVHEVEEGGELAGEKLSALGIPPYDIVRVSGGTSEQVFLLAGDREAVMN